MAVLGFKNPETSGIWVFCPNFFGNFPDHAPNPSGFIPDRSQIVSGKSENFADPSKKRKR
jgi:hypothetical protein